MDTVFGEVSDSVSRYCPTHTVRLSISEIHSSLRFLAAPHSSLSLSSFFIAAFVICFRGLLP